MPRQPTIVGQAVLLVIDIQKSAFMDYKAGIPVMPGYHENMERAKRIVDAAHEADIPIIFFQEIHRRNKIDYGRELDGTEDIHCLEGTIKGFVGFPDGGFIPHDFMVANSVMRWDGIWVLPVRSRWRS